MKIDFANISDIHIEPGKIFYLYGNYKKAFDVFCDFVIEKFKNKFKCAKVDVFYISFSECIKIKNEQCDLFEMQTRFFCIKNIEDNHIDKFNRLFSHSKDIFILDSGDYRKSKKVNDFCLKQGDINAIASFKNDATLISLCKMLFPAIPSAVHYEIVKIINNTDEELFSLLRKISILLDEGNLELLKQYTIHKQSFLQDMDFIPLVRYLLRLSTQEKIYDKKHEFIALNLLKENAIEDLIKSEIYHKTGITLGKSYLYHILHPQKAEV